MSEPAPPRPSADGAKTRILNVPIPEPLFWHLHDNAQASRMKFKHYMARCLAETRPYPPAGTGTTAGPQTGPHRPPERAEQTEPGIG